MFTEIQKKEIHKLIIKNALDYGKAKKESVISKVFSKFPELKSEIKTLSQYLDKEILEINMLSKKELEKESMVFLEEFKKEAQEKAEKSAKHNFSIEGAEFDNFMTRFPPEPNGYMQIGHAKVAFTEREFADVYKGKLALYFDDTNPEKEKQEYVDEIKKDLLWLGINYELEYYASDNIELIYSYAEKLISMGKIYACSCSPENVKKSRSDGVHCKHKNQAIYENMDKWREMLKGTNSEDIIMRLNYDLKAQNTTMRDPTLFRIKDVEHYRQGNKYTVWPTYAINTPIIDSIKGVTDVIRSKEFELMDELYFYLLDALNLRKPRIHTVGRLEIKDNLTSKRKINELVKQGLLWGYDDPRLVTIAGLRRRGVKPQAIKEFSLRFGMKKNESNVNISMLLDENKKILDYQTKRLFYIDSPLKIEVKGIPVDKKNIKLKLHPTTDLGYRSYTLSNIFFINTYDANNLIVNGDLRFKDLFDVTIESIDKEVIIARYNEKKSTSPKLQWVNYGNLLLCKLYEVRNLLNGDQFNNESIIIKEGYVESYAESLSEGEVVQFERTGFVKLDKKSDLSFISL
ncbi:MAG: glutamate--tRNA ligase [Candidatus Micrarchaeaceae archaeon]